MSWLESQNKVDCWCLTTQSLSVCLCVVKLYFLVLSAVRWNLNDEQKHHRLNIMENVATGLVFIIVVVNVFITAFGVHRPHGSDWPRTRAGILSVFANHIYSLCSPSFSPLLSLSTHRSFLSCLTLQFAPINIHVSACFWSSPVLSEPDLYNPLPDLQTHWPLQALREISTGQQLKNKIQPLFICQKVVVRLSEQERNSSSDKRGLVRKQHSICS